MSHKLQALSAIKGAQLASFIKPTVKTPVEFLPSVKGDDEDKPPTSNPEYDP
jgi:hypothetical protein